MLILKEFLNILKFKHMLHSSESLLFYNTRQAIVLHFYNYFF